MVRLRLIRLLLILIVAFVVAGCNGGTVDRHALRNDGATLDSVACEGALLAADVARGRTTTYFAREQAEELRIQSSNLADALSRRKALSSIERSVREKAKHAAMFPEFSSTACALDENSTHGSRRRRV